MNQTLSKAFECPYCGTYTNPGKETHCVIVLDSESLCEDTRIVNTLENIHDDMKERVVIIQRVCANDECGKAHYDFVLKSYEDWPHLAQTYAKVYYPKAGKQPEKFPSYVNKLVSRDYQEAFLIQDISPRASAMLSRRCLQLMIKDLWPEKFSGNAILNEMIKAIQPEIPTEINEALKAIQQIGNDATHPQKDLLDDVEITHEIAQIMTQSIAILIREWYIVPHERKERLRKIKQANDKIKQGKKDKKNPSPECATPETTT